jgi:glycosyltransferase involved in cell wall biosynthesis
VIYSGSITESKGIFLMLAGLIEAKKRGHVFRCVMVGAFNDRFLQEKVVAKIRRESLEDQVFFAGMLPLEEVTEYYRQSKIAFCLFPKNRTNQLILPIKLFEYAAFGLPVVGSDFGHIAEIIQTNQIGVCVDPHNAGAVAAALIDLLAEDRYQTFIPACIRAVETKYLWRTQESELLRIYSCIV